MSGLMQQEGLPYGNRTMTYNSRLAQELAAWADSYSAGFEIHNALFRSYFVDGRNFGIPETLIDVAVAAGLDPAEAQRVIDERPFKDAVDTDWQLSRRYGITGVPTFVIGQNGVSGAQPYEVLERLVTDAGVAHRDSV